MTHTLTIPDYHPTRLNDLLNCHWAAAAKKKRVDRDVISLYARMQEIPQAETKRRVSMMLTLAPRQRAGDNDAFWKTTLDALVKCGLIRDDNRQWCELGQVTFKRGETRRTEITLEDL
jgi:Holliday junction resolvase RusA-like endonuclease